MQTGQATKIERHSGKINEGGHPAEPVEWWYYNAILDSPGTPLDGYTFVTIFTGFRNVTETVHGLLIPPEGEATNRETIDLSGYELPPGSIQINEEKVGICWEENWCRGQYPDWQVHFQGEHGGRSHCVDLAYQAGHGPGGVHLPLRQ